MTIQEELSTLREALLQHAPDKKVGAWEDSFLYSIWKKQRAEAIRDEAYASNMQTYCLELEDALSHECGCIEVGCKVRKSVYPLPQFIGENVSVRTLDHTIISHVPPNAQFSKSLDPILSGKRFYSIVNRYLLIWNDPYLKAVEVEALWEDPYDWLEIQYCNADDTSLECVDLDTVDAGLTERQSNMTLRMSLNILLPLLSIPVDGKADIYPKE